MCNAAFLALDVVPLSSYPLLSSRENALVAPFPFYPTSRENSCPKDGVVLEGVGEEGEGYPQRCCVIFWKFIYLNKNGRRRERRGETVSVNRIHSHCHGFQCQASRWRRFWSSLWYFVRQAQAEGGMLAALAREGVENTSLVFLPLFFHDQRTHCAAREPRALSQCLFGVVFWRYFKNSSEM